MHFSSYKWKGGHDRTFLKIIDIIHKTFVIQGEKGSQGNTGNAGKNGEKVSENCCFDAHNLNVLSDKKLTFHVVLLSFLWSDLA